MRIGIVSPYSLVQPGGVQQLCRELAERLAESGDEVLLAGPDGVAPQIDLGRSVTIPANATRAPISLDPGVRARMADLAEQVDVIHLHEPLIPFAGWAGLRQKIPLVVTFHADPVPWIRSAYRYLGKPLARLANRSIITAASPVAASALPSAMKPIRVIPNALEVAAYRSDRQRDPNRVVFFGRDEPRKGLDTLLDAWPLVTEAFPGARLVATASRQSGDETVSFVGRVSEADKVGWLAASQIHVNPNLGGESFGIVLAEGMAAGCAPVASDIPAFRYVADDAACFFPPGDTASLARAIVGLLIDPAAARQLGEAARARVERFDWVHVVGEYRRAYQDAIDRNRG